MWRCRCGETNLEHDARCRSCEGLRRAAERGEDDYTPPKRWKAVQVGFFGLGMDDPRGEPEGPDHRLSEAELDDYYHQEARRQRLLWLVYALAGVVVVGLLAWQIFRPD